MDDGVFGRRRIRREPHPLPAPFDAFWDTAWLLLRLAVGLPLIPHAMRQLFGLWGGEGIEAFGQSLAAGGYWQPGVLAWAVGIICYIGGMLIAVGYLTRPAALLVTVVMGGLIWHHLPNGFFWHQGGVEVVLMWSVAAGLVTVGGGGRWSIDHAIGLA